jgi:hypothetical protein
VPGRRFAKPFNPKSEVMNEQRPLEPDPLTQWLAVSRSPQTGVDALRQSVLHRTTRVLRQRRWLRRGAVVLALSACFAAGAATTRVLTPPPSVVTVVVKEPAEPALPVPQVEPPQLEKEPTAIAMEWDALDHPEKKVESYRRAGDRYLSESNDVQAAVRCYKQMLDAGTEKDWIISPDDNWLLMALKEARQKEKLDAKAN